MKIKKIFWDKIDLIITILLIFFVVIFWYFSLITGEPLKSLLINLTAGFVGSIITIWGIEFFRRKQSELKWNEAKKVAKEDIIKLKNMLVSYISSPLGFTIFQYKNKSQSLEQWSEDAIKNTIVNINKQNIVETLNQLSIEQWGSFKINLLFIHSYLFEKIQLYGEVLPPEILGQLLKIKKNFDGFYYMFNLVPELFTNNENNWPLNKGGLEDNRLIRNTLIDTLSQQLKIYFKEIDVLINLLEKIKF